MPAPRPNGGGTLFDFFASACYRLVPPPAAPASAPAPLPSPLLQPPQPRASPAPPAAQEWPACRSS
eukprot:5134423-Prymnesium_polylepis.1